MFDLNKTMFGLCKNKVKQISIKKVESIWWCVEIRFHHLSLSCTSPLFTYLDAIILVLGVLLNVTLDPILKSRA